MKKHILNHNIQNGEDEDIDNLCNDHENKQEEISIMENDKEDTNIESENDSKINNENNPINKKSKLRVRSLTELRPAIREKIKYKLFTNEEWKIGNVIRVGKASGKDKNTCWIKDN